MALDCIDKVYKKIYVKIYFLYQNLETQINLIHQKKLLATFFMQKLVKKFGITIWLFWSFWTSRVVLTIRVVTSIAFTFWIAQRVISTFWIIETIIRMTALAIIAVRAGPPNFGYFVWNIFVICRARHFDLTISIHGEGNTHVRRQLDETTENICDHFRIFKWQIHFYSINSKKSLVK